VRAVVSRNTGFGLVAYAFLVTMIGPTPPTPVDPLVEERYSCGELVVPVIFAVSAFGVIGGLLVFGNLSDEIGRKPVLLIGLAFSAISALLFVFAGSLVPIFAGRVVSGFSAVVSRGTGTAMLVDLAPGANRRLGSLVAVVVNLGGLGLGTLLAGVLADHFASPLRLPFIVDLGLLVPAVVGLLLTPETVERQAFRLRLQRLKVPPEVRSVFIRGATAGFGSFAVAGVFSSVAPVFLGTILGRTSHALAGSIVFILFSASIVGQLLVSRLSDRRGLVSGRALLGARGGPLPLALRVQSLAAPVAPARGGGPRPGPLVGAA